MNEAYEKEIDLKWLIYRVFRAWKPILLWAIAVGLAVGLGRAGLQARKLMDEELLESAQLAYEDELAAWTTEKDNLLKQLENLEKEKSRQQEYNDQSVLMKIDPLRKNVASFELYVDYDYKINPELTYQQTDLSGHLLKTYYTYMTNGEMISYIMDHLNGEIGRRYLNEVVETAVDYSHNMISVTVVHFDSEQCREILSLAKEAILSRYDAVCSAIAEHDITLNNQSAYEIIDLKLDETQTGNVQKIADIETKIQEVDQELAQYANEPVPADGFSVAGIVKSSIKTAALAGAVVLVVLAAAVAVASMMSGKLLNPRELKDRFGLRVIGQLPADLKKTKFAGISRIFAKFGGITVRAGDYDGLAKMIGSSIKFDVESRKAAGNGTIAFAGTATAQEIEKAVAAMGLQGYHTMCTTNVLADAAAVEKVAEADYVVLVEEQEKAVMDQIERELEALKAWNKTVVGVVVLNADAVV